MYFIHGSFHRPGGTDLTSYYIYDQPVLAPADGTVTYVLDGHPDLPIGSVDSQHPTGNQLVIDIGDGRYLLMGHLHQHSITVTIGERVTEGQQIARDGTFTRRMMWEPIGNRQPELTGCNRTRG